MLPVLLFRVWRTASGLPELMRALGDFGVAERMIPVSRFGLEMGLRRRFQSVSGELAAGKVILFVVRMGGGQVGMGRCIVQLRGSLMSLL